MKKKKNESLDISQIRFIASKVKTFNSFEEVKEFYCKKDRVSKFALRTAKKHFSKQPKIKRRKRK